MYVDREKARARGQKNNRTFVLIFGWLFAVVGVTLMGIGVWVARDSVDFKKRSVTTQAVIVAMQGKTKDNLGTPVVHYVVDGKVLQGRLTTATSDMRPGVQISVRYDRNNPQDVRYTGSDGLVVIVLLFMGLVFGGMGTLVIVMKKRHSNKIDRLIAGGYYVQADVTNIELDEETYARGRHPIILSCRYVDPQGRVYLFRSGSVWYDSHEVAPGRKVRVYMDRTNPASYYVDVDSVIG